MALPTITPSACEAILLACSGEEVVQMAPMERILLETDSPYLAPVPYRGKRNSSLYLPYVVQEIAELKGISEEEVIETTEKNAVRLFRAEE